MNNNIIKKSRLISLAAVLLILLVVYLISLYKLQIVEGKKYYEESKNSVVTTETVIAARGNILDRYGRLLVTNTSCYNLVINTGELFPSDKSVDSNAVILQLVNMVHEYGNEYSDWLPITDSPPFEYKDMSATDEARLNAYKEARGLDANASAVEVLSDMRNRYEIDSNYSAEEARIIASVRYAVNVRYLINTSDYIFVENADMDLITAIKENNVVGVAIKESFVREYQTEYAAHILGYINWMNEDQYEKYSELGYTGDTKVGQEGAERAFEDYLHGENGTVQYTSAEDGTVVSTEYTKDPVPGNNVYLTIDIQLQEAAERALKNGIESISAELAAGTDKVVYVDGEWLDKDIEVTGGAAVVVDVKTGEPLAIASYPTYDLTSLLDNYSQIASAENSPLYNRALQGEYAPGSTFKPCTSIAGLTEGVINTETRLPCGGIYTKYEEYGYAPQCWIYGSGGAHGPDNIPEALRDSCNCFFYEVGRQLGIDRMEKYAHLLGLGVETGIELPEHTGNMSNSATHYDWVGEDWTIGDTLQAAIGQSDSMFTPLQLAEYCAAVANNGQRHSASILKYVRSYDYSDKLYERDDEVISEVKSEQYNWDAIHYGMYMVANDWAGSGYHVFEGYSASTVACKTGTAQKGKTVSNDGIFICYAPYENPEIAIAVVVERGGAGANCGRIAREILEVYFGIKTASDITETEGGLLR